MAHHHLAVLELHSLLLLLLHVVGHHGHHHGGLRGEDVAVAGKLLPLLAEDGEIREQPLTVFAGGGLNLILTFPKSSVKAMRCDERVVK